MNKEERGKVRQLNSVPVKDSGTGTEAIGYKDPDDIIEATVMAIGEYCDMAYYWSTLENIHDDFGESFETFYPEECAKSSKTNQKYFDQADMHLEKASEAINELMNLAEEKCKKILTIVIFSSSNEVIQYFFEKGISVKEEVIHFVLNEKLIEVFGDIDYNGEVEDSALMFIKALKEKFMLYEKIGINKV
jgi:hypothetical protein